MHSSPNIRNIQLSRRKALGLAGALIASPAIARADDTPVTIADRNLQGAGFYRRKIGAFDVFVISDGTFPFAPPYPLFGANAGEEKVKAALENEFIRYDHTLGHVNTLLVKTPKDVVLIDTGCGNAFGPTTGKLQSRLANTGIDAKEVTAVVITHAHPDHVGGIIGQRGAEAFPNAHFFMHKAEKDFWTSTNPDFSNSALSKEEGVHMTGVAVKAIETVGGRVTLIDANNKIVDGVNAIPAFGHTPGHIAVQVADGQDELIYITDAVHHYAIIMPNPDWHVGFDTDRAAAVKTRRALLDRVATDKVLVSGAHLPFPAFGHVRKVGDGFQWVPSVWEWT